MSLILLTRDQFRESVFKRDNNCCIVCKFPAKDAHHIIERRLFSDGGYYLENGASLCEKHHLEAEQTTLSCDEISKLIGITRFPIPEHLYKDQSYDKWGNPILSNGLRLKGELFNDLSVQKILNPVLSLFTDKIKYPRTYHLPWSPGATKDDRILNNTDIFNNVIVTVKMDGENTTMYSNYIHARSIEDNPHPSRSWIKSFHASIKHNIPEGWRVCGENLYAKHSINYNNLKSYFYVFSIWNANNICLSWDDTLLYCKVLDLVIVPELYRGPYNENEIKKLYKEHYNENEMEGYVVRNEGEFHYKDFRNNVGKYVRKSHVTTHGHWMRSKLEINNLEGK